MRLKHFSIGKIAHSSYILAGAETCAVVDPRRDVDIYINEARSLGLVITHIIETHLHADFVSGHMDLAEATGGFTYRLNNNLVPALDQVADEMGTYYVLGYAPPGPNDGRFRRVRVRVEQKGLRVRTKKGYIAGPPSAF